MKQNFFFTLIELKSPVSMKITHRQLEEGAKLSLADTLKMEYRISQGCMVSYGIPVCEIRIDML